jgi:hypothetical protein
MKKIVIFLVLLFCVGMISPIYVKAENQWYDCIVERIGPDWIELTDSKGTFSHKWFVVPVDKKNQFLAMGLTCLSNDSLMHVNLDPSNLNYWLTIAEAYVVKQ